MKQEGGAAVVLVVVAFTVLLTVGTMLGFVAGVVRVHRQAQSAADLTALAGARTLGRSGDACQVAAEVARANDAWLARCEVIARDVVVSVGVDGPTWWGFTADPIATARANVG